jgi:hypothetical protein
MDEQTDEDWTDLVTPDMLKRRMTLHDYFAERSEWVRKGHVTQSAVDQDRAQLERRAQPDDEWWEWLHGTEPLMQMGGLALVRSGRIVWARQDWIS